mmetsp:Transcript_19643/g.27402  ORF Transcript_19643/g.27402 Transcript_19643/m.27402 type:complete len:362 (-) Transcript_19643:123-1208(-)
MARLNYALLPYVLFAHQVIAQPCSGTKYLTSVNGIITSNSGGEYSSNAYCVWELLPPNSNFTYVEITFTSFDTWPDSDYVYVYNGPSTTSQKILQWSGWNLPDPTSMFSTQASMTVVFTADGDVMQGTGFTASYQWLTGTPPPCTGTIEVTSGDSVLNIQYSSLPQNFECTYLIKSGWTSLDYDYTASATLNSFYDSANALEVSVYAITEGESIEWYDYPIATWNTWSSWGDSASDDTFWGELPTLQIKVVGSTASSQPTSFSISYSFTRDMETAVLALYWDLFLVPCSASQSALLSCLPFEDSNLVSLPLLDLCLPASSRDLIIPPSSQHLRDLPPLLFRLVLRPQVHQATTSLSMRSLQ